MYGPTYTFTRCFGTYLFLIPCDYNILYTRVLYYKTITIQNNLVGGVYLYTVNTLHAIRIYDVYIYSFGRASLSIARDGHHHDPMNAHKYIILFVDYYIIYYYIQFTIIYFVFNLFRSTYIDNRLRSNSKQDIPIRFLIIK